MFRSYRILTGIVEDPDIGLSISPWLAYKGALEWLLHLISPPILLEGQRVTH